MLATVAPTRQQLTNSLIAIKQKKTPIKKYNYCSLKELKLSGKEGNCENRGTTGSHSGKLWFPSAA